MSQGYFLRVARKMVVGETFHGAPSVLIIHRSLVLLHRHGHLK